MKVGKQMIYAYIVGDQELQIIDRHYDGSYEVYNFLDSNNYEHSHIHYSADGDKTVYRSLSNPNSNHKFYPLESYADAAIQVRSVYEFPFDFESINSILDLLDEDAKKKIQWYLKKYEETKRDNTTVVKKRTRISRKR